MKDEEFNPFKNILYRKKNSPTQPTQPTQLVKKLQRSNKSFWVLPNVADGFRQYARFTDKTFGECVEDAFIEYMRNHPLDQVSLSITKDIREVLPNLADRLKGKIFKNRLSDKLELIIRLHEIGNEHEIKRNLPDFQKAVEKALKVKNPDKGLLDLLRESEDYL